MQQVIVVRVSDRGPVYRVEERDPDDPNPEQGERLQEHLDKAQEAINKAHLHIEEARRLRFPLAFSTRVREEDDGDNHHAR